jgi:hypothetical protein
VSYFGVLRNEALSSDRRPVARRLENVEISAIKTEGTPSGAKHTLILTKGIGNNGF